MPVKNFVRNPIDDCAKDGGEEFFTDYTAFFNRIPIESLKICNSNAMHLGKKFLAASFGAFPYRIPLLPPKYL